MIKKGSSRDRGAPVHLRKKLAQGMIVIGHESLTEAR